MSSSGGAGGVLTLVVPARPAGEPSGGDRYDAAVAAAWRARGRRVRVEAVAGSWPRPTGEDLGRLAEVLLGGSSAASVSHRSSRRPVCSESGEPEGPEGGGGPVLIDGLVGCAAPEVVERCAARRPTALLVHAVLSEGAGAAGEDAAALDRAEARALRAAGVVVATSRFAAQELERRYGLTDVVVARPGADPAPVAAGTPPPRGPQLLTLAAVTPVKNHGVLLRALAGVRDLPWSARMVGPAPDPGHLDRLLRLADDLGVADRVDWPGTLVGEALDRTWATSDLLVHPSRSETYGLVVVEAHAHGIPTVVGAGTGAVEALAGGSGPEAGANAPETLPGTAVAVDGPDPLAGVLRAWLTQDDLRRRWRDAALARRERLEGWDRTTEQLDAALARMGR
ncbi:glycosyltransferase family 4 protein [Ornithinimicrobium sp. W1679]|uniref:glycosyltransferase family 4 protein n=1 Tax=Ornithinimicrobium sp. W1679 TaxID=3418770 RepID=UPI003CE6E1F4